MRITPEQFDDLIDTADVLINDGDDFRHDESSDVPLDPRLRLLAEINDLIAASPAAGTHAYEMMAAVEQINAGNTAVLIELIAAVVMLARNDNPLCDQLTVTFSPHDIDEMQKRWEMDAKRDDMWLTVTLTRKPEAGESWLADTEENGDGAKPQAEAADTPERPVWAIRNGLGSLFRMHDKADAERQIRGEPGHELQSHFADDPAAVIENRWCLHPECPSSICNRVAEDTEATSKA